MRSEEYGAQTADSPAESRDADVAIQLRGVSKMFKDDEGEVFTALSDVSLDVRENEFVSFIGPSGCGKTTLLKIVDGLVPHDDGDVLVYGKPVTGPGPERAVVFQNFALLPWMSVLDNIGFGLTLRGVSRKESREQAEKLLHLVGLDGFGNRYPRQLSGGMQQRVGIARALAVNPRILLMDEPFGSLDSQTRHIMQEDLLKIWETQRSTVVFVTHSMEEAVYLSDRIVLMGIKPGHVKEVLDVDLPRPRTDAIRRDPRFTELNNYVWEHLRSMIVRDEPKSA